jgi:hypothetical protein
MNDVDDEARCSNDGRVVYRMLLFFDRGREKELIKCLLLIVDWPKLYCFSRAQRGRKLDLYALEDCPRVRRGSR